MLKTIMMITSIIPAYRTGQAARPCRTEQADRHTQAHRCTPLEFTTRKPLWAMKVKSCDFPCLLQTPAALQGGPVDLHSGRVSRQGLLPSSQSALGAGMKRSQHSHTWAISFPRAIGRGLPHDREKLCASSLWGWLFPKWQTFTQQLPGWLRMMIPWRMDRLFAMPLLSLVMVWEETSASEKHHVRDVKLDGSWKDHRSLDQSKAWNFKQEGSISEHPFWAGPRQWPYWGHFLTHLLSSLKPSRKQEHRAVRLLTVSQTIRDRLFPLGSWTNILHLFSAFGIQSLPALQC